MAKTIDELAQSMAESMQKNSYTGRDFSEVKDICHSFCNTIKSVLLYSELNVPRVQRATIELSSKGFNQSRVLGEIVRLVGSHFRESPHVFDVLGEIVATYNEYAVQHTRQAVERLVTAMIEPEPVKAKDKNPYIKYLNDRQKSVLYWLRYGLSNGEIGEKIGTTRNTASTLLSQAKKILQLKGNREDIQEWARVNIDDNGDFV